MQGSLLNQNRGDGSLALVKLCLNHQASCVAVRVCLEFLHVCREKNHVEKVIDTFVRLRGNRADNRIAAPVFRNQLILHELLLDALNVCIRLIHLVDSHNNLYIGSLCMADCLNRLRHDAVIRSDNQNRNVRCLGTAHTHCREGLVAGCVEEGNQSVVRLDLVCTDVLGNAARLATCDRSLTDGIEKRSLTVVNVTHDDNNRRTGHHLVRIFIVLTEQLLDNIYFLLARAENLVLERNLLCLFIGNLGIHRVHLALGKELLDEIRSGALHHLCEFTDGEGVRKNQLLDFLFYLLGLRLLRHDERMARCLSGSAAGLESVLGLMALVVLVLKVVLIRSAGDRLLHQCAVAGGRGSLGAAAISVTSATLARTRTETALARTCACPLAVAVAVTSATLTVTIAVTATALAVAVAVTAALAVAIAVAAVALTVSVAVAAVALTVTIAVTAALALLSAATRSAVAECIQTALNRKSGFLRTSTLRQAARDRSLYRRTRILTLLLLRHDAFCLLLRTILRLIRRLFLCRLFSSLCSLRCGTLYTNLLCVLRTEHGRKLLFLLGLFTLHLGSLRRILLCLAFIHSHCLRIFRLKMISNHVGFFRRHIGHGCFFLALLFQKGQHLSVASADFF